MMPKNIACIVLVGLLFLAPIANAQDQEIKDYTVIAGDTLWDISNKELGDPFLWPKIWKENPDIANPDRLKPGMIVRIPYYLLRKEVPELVEAAPAAPPKRVAEAVKPSAAPPAPELIVNKSFLMECGYITETVGGRGTISSSPSGRNLFGLGDIVYLKTIDPVNIGEKFYILKQIKQVIHPATEKPMGYLVEIRGIAQVLEFENGKTKAKIIHASGDIVTDDPIDQYYEITPPVKPGQLRKPNINGMIVSARGLHIYSTLFDILYLDKGASDGLIVGDMLKTVHVGKNRIANGEIQIISTRGNTSTAIVRKNYDQPIKAGDIITKLD